MVSISGALTGCGGVTHFRPHSSYDLVSIMRLQARVSAGRLEGICGSLTVKFPFPKMMMPASRSCEWISARTNRQGVNQRYDWRELCTRSTIVAFLLALSVAIADEPAEVPMPKEGAVTMASWTRWSTRRLTNWQPPFRDYVALTLMMIGIPCKPLRTSPCALSPSSLRAWASATSLGHTETTALSPSPPVLWRSIWSRKEAVRSSLLSWPLCMSDWYSCAGRWREAGVGGHVILDIKLLFQA